VCPIIILRLQSAGGPSNVSTWLARQISKPQNLCDPVVPSIVFQIGWTLHFTGALASRYIFILPLHSSPNCRRMHSMHAAFDKTLFFSDYLFVANIVTGGDANLTHGVFILPFFVISQIKLKKPMRFAVYSTLSLGAVDLAFSLTRFIAVQTSNVGDLRSFTTIGMLISSYMFSGAIPSSCGTSRKVSYGTVLHVFADINIWTLVNSSIYQSSGLPWICWLV
jgi:hypothetical protein